LTNC